MFIPPKYMLYTGFCCISSRPALKVCSDLKTMRQTIRSRYWPVRYLKYPSLKVMLKSLGSQMNQRIGSLGRLLRLQSRFVGAERIREVGHQRVTQRYRTAAASLAFQFRWTTYIIIYIYISIHNRISMYNYLPFAPFFTSRITHNHPDIEDWYLYKYIHQIIN